MITDLKETDHGSYQCRAENEVETLDSVAEVIVQGYFTIYIYIYTYSHILIFSQMNS